MSVSFSNKILKSPLAKPKDHEALTKSDERSNCLSKIIRDTTFVGSAISNRIEVREAIAPINFEQLFNRLNELVVESSISKAFYDYLVYRLKSSVDEIKSQISETPIEKSEKINLAIINWLNLPGNPLKKLAKVGQKKPKIGPKRLTSPAQGIKKSITPGFEKDIKSKSTSPKPLEGSKRPTLTRKAFEKIAQTVISEIMKSEECVSLYSSVLNSGNFSNHEKINVILDHIIAEQHVFKLTRFSINVDEFSPEISKNIIDYIESDLRKECIAIAQIDFAHALINEFIHLMKKARISNALYYHLTNKLKKSIYGIENQINKTTIEIAKEVNQAIISWLNIQGNPMRGLTELRLAKSRLKAVLPCISELPLVSLDLSGNKITSLPSSISKSEKLENLHIQSNLMSFIPNSIIRLPHLKELVIHNNRLMAVDSVGQLIEIKYLDFSYNQIRYVAPQLDHIELEYLDFSDNQIPSIEVQLDKFPKLKYFDLRNNEKLSEDQIQASSLPIKKIKDASKRVRIGDVKIYKVKESFYPTPASSKPYPTRKA